ncbi:MAG: membrane protein insertase YidC [Actinomycetota bacterium]|nr:membrane protein insertase YidC [Actinomycetota bacterium]
MDTLMGPLYTAVSAIMIGFHRLLEMLGFDPASGVTWTLSIVGLVVVIRVLLIPLFVKQIKAQRGLQTLQPEIKKIQERYKNDRERQSQELMKLYRETGTNPLASCLPILAQAPIFFALFGVLNGIPNFRAGDNPRGVLTPELIVQAQNAEVFGAKIFDTFFRADNLAARIVALVLIVLMSATTFITQKQLMTKNMPAGSLTGPFAQQQKILLYVFPIVFAVTGVNFPIGVLIYWFTTNLWTMGQQLYVINRMPAPGSLAEQNLYARQAARQAGGRGGPLGRLASRVRPALRLGARTPDGVGSGVGSASATLPPPTASGATSLGAAPSPSANGSDAEAAARAATRQRQQPRRQPRKRRR